MPQNKTLPYMGSAVKVISIDIRNIILVTLKMSQIDSLHHGKA